MYEQFFGLKEQPFRLTPDTSYFFGYGDHLEALNTLLVALNMGEGFIKVTGEVGTGKTLLCRKLLNELSRDEQYISAYIPNPAITPTALKYALADELGIEYPRNIGQHKIMQLINQKLIDIKSEGKKAVLIIDESQALPEDCLEAVRLLTNLETEKSKLLQVVLLGQPELDENLEKKSVRQLKQRITFTHKMVPLTKETIQAYLAHRLQVAGYSGEAVFDQKISQRLFKLTNGVPRLINVLAHKCLLLAYGEGTSKITMKHLKKAVADTESLNQQKSGLKWFWVSFIGMSASTAALAGYYLMNGVMP
jgi:MSHA biogenesis protein MshM